MNIRQAKKEDIPQLAKLRWNFQREEENEKPVLEESKFLELCSAFLEKGLSNGNWVYWMAEENSVIVAHTFVNIISTIPNPSIINDRYGYLTNTYTKPEYRNQNIGTSILKQIKQWAKEEHLELLVVWPSEKSIKFYQRAGFSTNNDIMELKLR